MRERKRERERVREKEKEKRVRVSNILYKFIYNRGGDREIYIIERERQKGTGRYNLI